MDEEERLAALHRYRILDTDQELEFDNLARIAAQSCRTPIALISFVDQDRQWFKTTLGLDVRETPRSVSFCAHAIHLRDMLVVGDARQDKRFADNPLVTSQPHIRFYAGAPLMTPDGQVLGTLCVIDREPRRLEKDQEDILRTLAEEVIFLLERRLEADEERRGRNQAERAAEDMALLLRELRHRVKNHLQVITSLLALQRNREGSPEAQNALDRLHDRLKALVLLGEQFNPFDQSARVELGAYLRRLSTTMMAATAPENAAIAVELKLDEIDIAVETALPIGLIANEFITNSFKHGFPDHRGKLTIALERIGTGRACLMLADDGPGMAANPGGEGLGLRLIPALARQVGAECEWRTDKGTMLTLRFDI